MKKLIIIICSLFLFSGCGIPDIVIENAPFLESQDLGYGYQIKQGKVLFKGKVMQIADAKTFVVLESVFAKDEYFVFKNGELMKEYSPQEFEEFLKIVEDPNSLEIIKNPFHKDSLNVYRFAEKFHNADPNTFQIIQNEYSKDKNTVYYSGEILENADTNTFRIIDKKNINFSRDKENLYFYEKRVLNADPDNFVQIKDSNYWKDKYNIYYLSMGIGYLKNVDIDSFQVFENSYARDKNNFYHKSKKIDKRNFPIQFQ